MGGFVIRHPEARSVTVLVPLQHLLFSSPQECSACTAATVLMNKPQRVFHKCKTYHLNVDDAGRCTVSITIFENLQKVGAIDGVPDRSSTFKVPFEFLAEDQDPPPLTVGFREISDAEGRNLTSGRRPAVMLHEDFS